MLTTQARVTTTYNLAVAGLSEEETIKVSSLLSLNSDKLPRPWTLVTSDKAHAVLCDLSTAEGLLAWEQAKQHQSPVPVAYSGDTISDARWHLGKPAHVHGIRTFLTELTSWLERAHSHGPGNGRQAQGQSTDHEQLRSRLTVLAEEHKQRTNVKELKLIVGGSTGAGKTTLLTTLSEVPPIRTEVRPTDMVKYKKAETTVGLDYGELILADGMKLRLYGTPGQTRYEFMSTIICTGGLGLILLVDNSSENPLFELDYYLRLHGLFIRQAGAVLGVTHMDVKRKPSLDEYEEYLAKRGLPMPVFSLDPRSKEQALAMLDMLATLLEDTAARRA